MLLTVLRSPLTIPRVKPHYQSAVRLLLLVFLLTLLQPAPVLVTPGPRQAVLTEHAIVAVHTRLTDEVEPWKIQRSLELVREMGASSIVEFFPWAYYQAEDGSIAWEHPDLVVEHAYAQGLTMMARIGWTPGWARPHDTPIAYLDDTAYEAFARFAAAFAQRYQGKVDYLIVGNEPNLSREWGYRQTTPDDYVNLLRVVYPAVKAVNPDIIVLGGALAPTLEPPGSVNGLNELDYLRGMYEGGAAAYFDGLAVHTYGFNFPPDAEPDPTVLNFRRLELLRDIMVEYDDIATNMFITEMGWNDHPRWTMAVRPGARIQYTLNAFRYAETHWPYVKTAALWMFRLPAPDKSHMDYFTLVTPEFVLKPLYAEIKIYTGNQVP